MVKKDSGSGDNSFVGGRYKLAFDLMRCKPGMRILDVGCGTGGFLSSLYHRKNQLYGIDPDERSIAHVHTCYPDIGVAVAFGEQLPFASGIFDLVFALDVIEHANDDQRIIDEIFRVLKHGGVLILSVPHQGPFALLDVVNFKFYFPSLHRLMYRLTGKMDAFRIKFGNGRLYGNFSRYTRRHIRHKRFSVRYICSLLNRHFHIERLHRRGSLITLLCLAANSLYSMFFDKNSRLLFQLWFWDFSIDYGFLSDSLMVKARKVQGIKLHDPRVSAAPDSDAKHLSNANFCRFVRQTDLLIPSFCGSLR